MLKSVARALPRAARAPAAPRDLARSFATSATSGAPDLKAAPHFRMSKTGPDAFLPHPIYTREEMNEVGISHVEPKTVRVVLRWESGRSCCDQLTLQTLDERRPRTRPPSIS